MDKQTEMIEMCKELRLPSIRALIQQDRIFDEFSSSSDFLFHALKQEMDDRFIRAKTNRIRAANFP